MMDEQYCDALKNIITFGKITNPRGMETKELVGHQFKLINSRNCVLTNKTRKPNYAFMVAEWLWIMFGRNDTDFIGTFNKKILNYSDNGQEFYGAYGPSFTKQIYNVYEALTNDNDTRQAVMTIWIQNPRKSKDIPCTIAFQFLVRDNKLHTLAYMRSNDVFLGVPYDTFNFCQIGNMIANMIGVERGPYTLTAGSFHLYKTHYEAAQDVIADKDYTLFQTNDIDIHDFDDYIRAKDLFDYNAISIANGTLHEDIIDEFPYGIKEHIRFLNSYAARAHKKNEFWGRLYT